MQIQQDNFIQKLLSLEKGRAYIPDLRKKRTWYLKKLTDAKLVKYIRLGNNHAFDVLIKRHEAKLKRYLYGRLKDKYCTEDALQDVWLIAIPELRGSGYKEKGQFDKWLRTIAFRQAMLANRKMKLLPELREELPEIADEGSLLKEQELLEKVTKEAEKIIAEFSKKDQRMIRMHIEDGATFGKIAREMKLKENTAKSSGRRLMKRVQRALSAQGFQKNDLLLH